MDTPPTTDATHSPEEFLALIEQVEPGWSDEYGGPEGIAALCAELQTELVRQSEKIAAIRVAAIRQMLTNRSGVEVAEALGVSKSAISKSLKNTPWKDATW